MISGQFIIFHEKMKIDINSINYLQENPEVCFTMETVDWIQIMMTILMV